jgi:hypothetical protein
VGKAELDPDFILMPVFYVASEKLKWIAGKICTRSF